MPRYDYKCTTCGTTEEVEHAMDMEQLPECSTCSTPLKKIFSATPGHFKGQGWGKVYRRK